MEYPRAYKRNIIGNIILYSILAPPPVILICIFVFPATQELELGLDCWAVLQYRLYCCIPPPTYTYLQSRMFCSI